MLVSDTAIVLGIIPYNDNSKIVKLLSSKSGLLISLIKNNSKNKTSGYFAPLNILNLVYLKKPNQTFCTLKEINFDAKSACNRHNEILKINLKIFIGEILLSVIKDNSYDDALFNYILQSIIKLNQTHDSVANCHIEFLSGLIKILGIQPTNTFSAETPYFNIESGYFEKTENLSYPINSDISKLLSQIFLFSQSHDFLKLSLSHRWRKELLNTLIKYLDIHLHGLSKIKSLEILEEIFA